MKSIYLLILISFISSLTIKEKIECFTKNENLLNQVVKVIDSFKTKDFKTILITALSAFYSVKDEIKDCLNGEPTLKMTYCGYECRHATNKTECIDLCEKGFPEVEPINITKIEN